MTDLLSPSKLSSSNPNIGSKKAQAFHLWVLSVLIASFLIDLIHPTQRLRESHPFPSLCRLPLAAGVLAGVRGLAAPAPRLHLHHRQVPAARPQRPLRRPRHTLQARLHAGGKLLGFWEIMHFELNLPVS